MYKKSYLFFLKFIFVSIFVANSYAKVIITSESNLDKDPNRSILIQMANGFLLSRALTVAAQLNIADFLVEGSKNARQIASALNANENALYRLLRMLSSHGIFHENENHEFSLTELGNLLVTKNPKTIKNFLMIDDKNRWCSYGNLIHSISTGENAFKHTNGMEFFDFIKDKPDLIEVFDKGMYDISSNENIDIAQNIELANPGNTSIVDIGGGKGGLLTEIRKLYPVLKEIILFDYSPLNPETISSLGEQSILFQQGSFFEHGIIPQAKNIYILKRVLHDWANEQCLEILTNIKNAMAENSRILVIDAVLAQRNEFDVAKDVDIVMMALFGGQERTREEFQSLFDTVGLSIKSIKSIPNTMLSIIELVK